MKVVHPIAAMLWWVTFLACGLLSMLQMLVAIILDSYTLVRTDIGQYAPSLFEQGWNLLVDMSRWFQGYATTKDFLVMSQARAPHAGW